MYLWSLPRYSCRFLVKTLVQYLLLFSEDLASASLVPVSHTNRDLPDQSYMPQLDEWKFHTFAWTETFPFDWYRPDQSCKRQFLVLSSDFQCLMQSSDKQTRSYDDFLFGFRIFWMPVWLLNQCLPQWDVYPFLHTNQIYPSLPLPKYL